MANMPRTRAQVARDAKHPTWEYETVSSPKPFDRFTLNVDGLSGWELVSVYVDGRPGRDPMFYAVFKREAP